MPLTLDEKCDLLRRAALFAELEPDSLSLVAEHTQELEFPARHYIVRQGEIGTGFYIVIRGRARVVRNNEEIDMLGPGDFFGELALLDQSPRSANVQAVEPVTCLGLASWDLTAILEKHPRVTLHLLRQVVHRLRPYLKAHHH